MQMLGTLQGWIVFGLSAVALGVEVYALVDCLRRRPDAFVAAGKRTKQFWLLVTGVAVLLGFVALGASGSSRSWRSSRPGSTSPTSSRPSTRSWGAARGAPRALRPLVRRDGIPRQRQLAEPPA